METIHALVLGGLLAGSSLLHAQQPAEGPTPAPKPPEAAALSAREPAVNIFIEMQIVALPTETATPLVHELMDRKKTEEAYEKIQELLAHGGAELIGWPMIVTQNHERQSFEAVDEFRYVTDYEPGAIGVYFPDQATAEKEAPTEGGPDKKSSIAGTEFNAAPATFETRNTGVTLEVEPALSADARTIRLRISPAHVRLKGMTKVTLQRPGSNEQIIVEQPEFETKKSTQTVTMKSGSRMLLGVYPMSEPVNHLELFILKAEAKKVD